MIWKILGNKWAAAIVGALLIVIGFTSFDSSGQVKCGSEVMQPGDVCEETRRGKTTTRTYDEQKSSNRTGSYIMLGLGAVFLVVGGVRIAIGVAKGKPEANEAPAAPAVAGGPPAPPADGQPQP